MGHSCCSGCFCYWKLWLGSILLTSIIPGSLCMDTQNIYSSGCYKESINLECPAFHKIAIKRLFYGAKNDSRCSGQGRRHSLDCCHPSHDDCLVVDDTKYPFLNMLCSGQRNCDFEANSISSGMMCRAKGFGATSDYMSVIHDCIPDENIAFLCSNTHKRGKLLYLSNVNYPRPIQAGNQRCQCLIKTANHIGIDIHALDIIITHSEVGNKCYQDIVISDNDRSRKEITCGHPGLYAFRDIYSSDDRSVTLTLNNRSPKSQGYVWLQAKAKEEHDFVEIYCGDDMKIHLGEMDSPDEQQTLKPVTQPAIDPAWTGGYRNATGAGGGPVVSDIMALIVGVAVAVAVIIIIGLTGITILCVRRNQRKRSLQRTPPPFPSPVMQNKMNHSSNTYCKYDYDEDKYCSIKRSPMRMAKFSNLDKMAADRTLQDAFSQGVTAPEYTNQNGYINYCHQLSPSQTDDDFDKEKETLLEKVDETDAGSDSELIMPKSEFITIGRAVEPRPIVRDINTTTMSTMLEKKKPKCKTVTFSPVAMVTPLPSGSEESVPDDTALEDIKANYLEMYSKTLPVRSSSSKSPDRIKKVLPVMETQDDMCLSSFPVSGCENVTEEDLWQAFHIKLNEGQSDAKPAAKQAPEPPPKPQRLKPDSAEDPDYDENPYDNLPYINIGSLRRNNAPDQYANMYRDSLKRKYGHKPTIDSIPETC